MGPSKFNFSNAQYVTTTYKCCSEGKCGDFTLTLLYSQFYFQLPLAPFFWWHLKRKTLSLLHVASHPIQRSVSHFMKIPSVLEHSLQDEASYLHPDAGKSRGKKKKKDHSYFVDNCWHSRLMETLRSCPHPFIANMEMDASKSFSPLKFRILPGGTCLCTVQRRCPRQGQGASGKSGGTNPSSNVRSKIQVPRYHRDAPCQTQGSTLGRRSASLSIMFEFEFKFSVSSCGKICKKGKGDISHTMTNTFSESTCLWKIDEFLQVSQGKSY